MIKEIELEGRMVEYTLIRKKVKNINLRIDGGKVMVSCGPRVSVGYVEEFMRSKSRFIIAAIDKTLVRVNNSGRPVEYSHGERVKVWGEWCVINVRPLPANLKRGRVVYEYPVVNIEVQNPDDKHARMLAYENWKRAMVKGKLDEMTRYYYQLMLPRLQDRHCHSLDDVRYRVMKSKWGVCRPQIGVITYNYNLLEVPQEAVAYVVVHELCHLLEANHSSRFYSEVARVMPDYKSRDKVLRGCV